MLPFHTTHNNKNDNNNDNNNNNNKTVKKEERISPEHQLYSGKKYLNTLHKSNFAIV